MTDTIPQLRIAIVDDEPLARERTRTLLTRIGDIEVVGEASDGNEALGMLETIQPDVVLLDINMPGIDGLRLAEALDDPPAIIFSTAYEHHALKAFELDAVDYLLKPYSAERLGKALDRVRKQFAGSVPSPTQAESARIAVEDGSTIVLLEPDTIAAARIDESVVFVHTTDGATMTYAHSLHHLEEALPSGKFFRVSRQAMVGLHAVESVSPESNGAAEVRLNGGHKEIVSRRRLRHLKAALDF